MRKINKRKILQKKPSRKVVKKSEDRPQTRTALEALADLSLKLDRGVAVWLKDQREMSNEIAQFLSYTAKRKTYRCVSRCFKYKLRNIRCPHGMVLLFKKKKYAQKFCQKMADSKSPHGDYPFRIGHLGAYLREVAVIEQKLDAEQAFEGACKVIFRNLSPQRPAVNRVLELCSLFGTMVDSDEFQEAPSARIRFRHLLVKFRFAVQAIAAQLALDGKWVLEQEHPLSADLVRDGRVRDVCAELGRRDKLIFQC